MERLKVHYADFKRYLPLLFTLTSKDVKLKYRRSVLGILWSILNPLLTMIILTQVFGLLLRIQIPNFPVYYILGSTMFNFFSESTSSSMGAITGNASLIKKVYIPKYIFPLQKCMFALVNMMFSMIAALIVMIYYIIRGKLHLSFTILLFPVPIFYCFLFSIGISLILSAISVFFRDMFHLWGVLMTIWIYVTPIIYPMYLVENTWLMKVLRCNPLYYYVEYFRDVLMNGTIPGLGYNLLSLAFGVVAIIFGVLIFKKLQDRFILHV